MKPETKEKIRNTIRTTKRVIHFAIAPFLFILAWVLYNVFLLFFILFAIMKYRKDGARLRQYFMNIAESIDQTGNATGEPVWNFIFIKFSAMKDQETDRSGQRPRRRGFHHPYGDKDETISSALGKNKRYGTSSRLARVVSWFLGLLEDDHVEKSIEENP